MKRIFIAIKIEPEEKLMKMISSYKSALSRDNIKWINPDNIHITIVFLGDTEDTLIASIIRMLIEKCEKSGRFELIIKGTGVFKNLNDPRIIWTGIEKSEKLINLSELIQNGLTEIGIKTESRPFNPHLTMGRIKHLKPGNNLKELIGRYKEMEFQKVSVNEVILFESKLHSTGPEYIPIRKFVL
jgi:2'-5' RNA ligase